MRENDSPNHFEASGGSPPVAEASEQLDDLLRTDVANAKRLAKHHAHELLFSGGRWMVFNETHWEPNDLRAQQIAQGISRHIRQEAVGDGGELSSQLSTWAERSEGSARINAALKEARPLLHRAPAKFDQHHQLVNLGNGTWDLKNSRLVSHDAGHLITRMSNVEGGHRVVPRQWLQFIDEICCGDEDLAEYLQKVLGYSMSGATSEQKLFYLLGGGANGKSTLLETLEKVLGSGYVKRAPAGLLTSSGTDRNGYDVASLEGSRIVLCQEVSHASTWDEVRLKELTGEPAVKVRGLYEDFRVMAINFKLFVAANHLPQTQDLSDGFWRRLVVIPFNHRVTQPTPNLAGVLAKNEGNGIFNWLADGYKMWEEETLSNPPAAVTDCLSGYKQEADPIEKFIAERCIKDSNNSSKASDLYKTYCSFCDSDGLPKLTQTKFGKELGARGYEKTKKSDGVWYSGLEPSREAADVGGMKGMQGMQGLPEDPPIQLTH